MLIGAVDCRVLRLVVLDEVHLHVQQRTSFRPEISRNVLLWSFGRTVDVNNNRERMLSYKLDSSWTGIDQF